VPKFAANLTMLFGEQPFLDRFAAAKAAGFSGVEYLFPYDFDKAELREQLHQHGLTQVLHNLPAGNWGAGERGIAILPTGWRSFATVSRAPSTTPRRSIVLSSTAWSALRLMALTRSISTRCWSAICVSQRMHSAGKGSSS